MPSYQTRGGKVLPDMFVDRFEGIFVRTEPSGKNDSIYTYMLKKQACNSDFCASTMPLV
jgi:hypothetical protein